MSKDLKHFLSAFLAALAVFGALGILILSRPETVKRNAGRDSTASTFPSSDVQSTQQMATTSSASERLASGDDLPAQRTVSAQSKTLVAVTEDISATPADFTASAERITPSIWSSRSSGTLGIRSSNVSAQDQLKGSIHTNGVTASEDGNTTSSPQAQAQPQTNSSALQKMYMDSNGRIRTMIYTPEELRYRLLYGWVAFNNAQLEAVNPTATP